MKRGIIKDLIKWKTSKNRKPLILIGARQVGKTWIMKEFGKTNFKNYAYIMFERNKNMEELFRGSLKPKDLIPFLQAESGVTIEPENTLIIFDEIQAVPNALTALKYFYEEAPEYAIIAGGSTLGITLHQGDSYPVGKTELLHLYPMTFKEFLLSLNEELLIDVLENEDLEKTKIFHEKLERYLRQYFYIGGMPEVVESWTLNHSYKDVRKIQKRLLTDYEQDFSKYATPLMATKIRMLWRSIPNQVSKENKKFIYGAVKERRKSKGL
jgi:predicted AAA+ superfamily ATPase